MDYLIVAVKDDRELLGSSNQALVHNAKTMIKVNNRLKWFTPDRDFDNIKIYYYTNLYDAKTHKLVKTILKQNHNAEKENN